MLLSTCFICLYMGIPENSNTKHVQKHVDAAVGLSNFLDQYVLINMYKYVFTVLENRKRELAMSLL